jgi:hypothetical protein
MDIRRLFKVSARTNKRTFKGIIIRHAQALMKEYSGEWCSDLFSIISWESLDAEVLAALVSLGEQVAERILRLL